MARMLQAYLTFEDFLLEVHKTVDITKPMMKKPRSKPCIVSPQKRGLPDPKAARRAVGLSGERLAEAIGCSASMVWTCEREHRYPVQRVLRAAYLRALGLEAK